MAFCSTLLLRVSPCSEASAYLYGKAFHYAKLVVIAMVDTLIPCGIMQSSPELTFLHASAAAKFLTQSASAYSITQQLEIKTLLYQLSRSYSSPDATIDHIHAPARHAAHINRLIDDLGP
ncbi:hypothetical protein BD309DRAFT_990374 [Dichomitus squalens]|uniref:Uncharacterized protein n=2 Tax=Dichomitus squalens TaxID=114155 RepID=A0A4Q9NU88_9APHY|nr:uncharacterized protein DICSQDRAFT_172796 [Dichomitus squalens LYAD-421 SS1]EJF58595.1 hypothetical protein DICSQDRAFT_172796 [Dichomitus squalens LYAD-421 SS1]TBU25027.1 hypothetical protein BD311DRAFT_809520 [Dichomitus squalens]TBU44307.1 hypothetical protein BD309DRAFT_990374 [Dichomitus squalens]TBU65221.1 hypothetical protein BD310DRAFT_306939 [Dichomitus squalens]